MSFETLGLSKELLKAIKEQGYDKPTPIQKQAIPVILEKKDVLAGAQTGTGKTAGFTLPMLELLHRAKPTKGHHVKALILTPTRELAAQVGESVELYGKHLPFKSTVIFGGVKINPQITKLKNGVDIVIATPGRLLDHLSQKTIDLSHVSFLILDEADRMLDMGFINDIKKILAILPKQRQNLLFSATYSDEIKKLSDRLLNAPTLIEVARANISSEIVKQTIYLVDCERKRELLTHLINEGKWQQVLVFTRTKHGANRLSAQLEKDGITSAAIHGNKSQNARTKALDDFKKGEVRVLVATDIAARGIDIDQLPHVVNFELPNVSEDYVHRIGRTGRAGNEGEAISLVCVDEHEFLANIEKLIKKDIQKIALKGFKPDPSIKAVPVSMGGNRGGNRGGAAKPKGAGGGGRPSNRPRTSQKPNAGRPQR
ncbi:MAG: DEAD/DEAH box helicase [Sulfurimonas sp.]|nr:DEAD/DEAH box helicase [Sulfurimonas sp.]MBU1217056.1 DEAD/DEAH box helicase [bacterium]MBU1435385.1 DEAD/DEAH box helicase [bacterium]MBU1502304.1 DEAD/DEAH box helicase [bacterium]MBU3940244.1 DEAD/DEAH box helicase [bacterium]